MEARVKVKFLKVELSILHFINQGGITHIDNFFFHNSTAGGRGEEDEVREKSEPVESSAHLLT